AFSLGSGTTTSLSLANAGTGSAFVINDTNTGSSNIALAVQSSATTKLTIDENGVLSLNGGSTPAVTTLTGGANLAIRPADNATLLGTGGNLTLNGGNETGGASTTGGNVSIDAGT